MLRENIMYRTAEPTGGDRGDAQLDARLQAAIKTARDNVLSRQDKAGWCFHLLYADCTMPA